MHLSIDAAGALGSYFSLVYVLSLVVSVRSVSVRRRDRCTCTALIRFAFLVLFCCTPFLLSVLISLRALLGSCALCLFKCFVCAVLLLLVFPVLLCVCCPVGLVFLCCLWLLRARRLFWFLCSSLCLCGPWCFPCCLPSLVVVPVSVLPAPPAPRVVLFVLWSSLHLGVLVPPSGYLVAAVTALLPCFHAGSVVKLCYPSVIRLMATKAASPVWGFHPLHHVTGDVGELSSAILRYSL